MTSDTEQTSHQSNEVADDARNMSNNLSSVASAMNQASGNTGIVATAAEEMSATRSDKGRMNYQNLQVGWMGWRPVSNYSKRAYQTQSGSDGKS